MNKIFTTPFYYTVSLFFMAVLLISACEEDSALFISPTQQIELGRQLDSVVMANSQEYPVLDSASNPQAYKYLYDIFNEILNSGAVRYRDEFPWQIKIIQDDSTLNAFAAPGGYTYVYTGLIKYLDQEDDLAGVLGHEIAHADLEHSARIIERSSAAGLVLDFLLGDNSLAGQVVGQLINLRFGRSFETQADLESVKYLSNTNYNCAAAGSFFEKLAEAGDGPNLPEFFSTHPKNEDRFAEINEKAQEIGCDTTALAPATYQDFKNMLP